MKMSRSLSVVLVWLAGCHSTVSNDAATKGDGNAGGTGGSTNGPGADTRIGDVPTDRATALDGVIGSQGDAVVGSASDANRTDGAGGSGGGIGGGDVALAASGGRSGDGGLDATPSTAVDGGASPDVPMVPPSNRKLDLVFMIDNSPSMAPKIAKLQNQFPKLIEALQDPAQGIGLPDLHVALIDSDLGTMGTYASGSCGPNDSNGRSIFGDQGKFQMRDAAKCGVKDTNALWLEYAQGTAINFTGQIGSVFACLAGNLGTMGCGIEHPLQAAEFALVAGGIGNEAQRAMLRPEASLGLVFLTDEDDCSAATNDAMFGDKADLHGEAASLRCSTRGHACSGNNLSDQSTPGYPTTTSFEAPLATCVARTDACPNAIDPGVQGTDTSVPTSCSPLRDYVRIANEIKALKADPANQILVAGIFGWPLGGNMQQSQPYKIAKTPNPNTYDTSHPQIFDTWPICYDPDHPPTKADPSTGFDATAAGWGATPGLRISAFIDQFGSNGIKFSICEADFGEAVKQIGHKLASNPYGATGSGGTGGTQPRVDFDALPSDAHTGQ
jgi:hypothetical protein